ncbi:hydroxymethylbilane synthase [Salisaeta longa]|uniref:hydroxymethylbilane synthase n=1 Tax=Salisaeta longa TaxID=503170 RepID=UPI0003B7650C|nr:hydroxymethylbilane synthase [Salisaeta longa]
MLPDPLILGTRGSELALWQANYVRRRLQAAGHAVRIETIRTKGDRVQDVPITQIGDEAVFTKELDRALLAGRIHVAVHSLKDLPSQLPDGLTLAAIAERAAPFDAFVAHPSFAGDLRDLPNGATVATASLRRKAQLKAWRPDLNVVPVRGNVDSRLEKLDASDWHGMILAQAGLERMGLADRIREPVPTAIMVPAVGQGALGIACAADQSALATRLHAVLHHEETGRAARAERTFMQAVGGGCQVPTGAWARVAPDGGVVIDGCIAALEGAPCYRERRTATPEQAARVARELAHALLAAGGRAVLETIVGAHPAPGPHSDQ